MKKYTLTALSVALCTAASSVGYGAVFSDITSNIKWAEKYINSVYESGIMVGDYNSRGSRVFRGSENMTYSEAAQLIYSIVNKSGFSSDVTQAGISRYSMEMAGEGIADWAKTAVAFCMEKGIVSSYDLTKFKDNGVDVKITREDMALFFGKALAMSYAISNGTSLSFNDTATISAPIKPYIELLNKLGVITGDNNNNFNPKANITRAEVAVIASKTYDIMKKQIISNPESGYSSTSGTVVNIYETNGSWILRITTASGIEGFALNSDTPVYINSSNNVGPRGLGLGDGVTVYYSGANVAKIQITKDAIVDTNDINSPQFSSTLKDKGELISAGEYKIGLIDKHGDRVYYTVATNAEITLNGRTATLRQLSDRIRTDAIMEVTVEVNSSKKEAFKVSVVEEKYRDNTEGKIVNLNSREISISSGSKNYKYSLADRVSVEFNGSSDSLSGLVNAFDKLKGNKYIDVELHLNGNDEVDKIEATESNYKENNDKKASGDIKELTSSIIKLGSKEYDLPSNKKDIDISVMCGIDEVEDFDELEEIFDTDKVTIKVSVVVEKGEVSKIDGYVYEINGDLEYMTVSNDRYPRGEMGVNVRGYGQITFKFDEDTRINIDGTTYDAEDINSLKKLVNNSGVRNATVKFDDDGVATRVSD